MIHSPMIMYGEPGPMNVQQGNMAMISGGRSVMVQPKGSPYNNSNI